MAKRKQAATGTSDRAETDSLAFTDATENVFTALGMQDADDRLAKAEMARDIALIVETRGWTQKRTAEELGIAASDASNLLRGKLRQFSQERLVRFLNALDMEVRIQIGPRPSWKKRAGISVERVARF